MEKHLQSGPGPGPGPGPGLGPGPESMEREPSNAFPDWLVYLLVACLAAVVVLLVVLLCWARAKSRMCWQENQSRAPSEGRDNHILAAGHVNLQGVQSQGSVEDGLSAERDVLLPGVPHLYPPVSVRDLRTEYQRRRADNNKLFRGEYESIPICYDQLSAQETHRPENRSKNRYEPMITTCYDHSRVKLKGPGPTDYINASFVKDTEGRVKFIATQGPLHHTAADFWQMVWEQQSRVIVMLCTLKYRNMFELVAQYWPEDPGGRAAGTSVYGHIAVQPSDQHHYADYTIRTFTIYNTQDTQSPARRVHQFHYTNWHEASSEQFCKLPRTPASLLNYLRKIHQHIQPGDGPPIVHCSGGTGETGMYIGLDLLRDEMEREGHVTVHDTVSWLRQHRSHMVHFEGQYVYLYRSLLECALYGQTIMAASELRAHVTPDSTLPAVHQEFQRLKQLAEEEKVDEDEDEGNDRTVGLQEENEPKNRYDFIIPFEKNRVKISSRPGEPNTCYINASLIDGYSKRSAYIITQDPLQDTAAEFWRMVWEHGVPAVVMLTEPGDEPTKCYHYWPTEESAECRIEYDGVVITYLDTQAYGGYTLRIFKLTHRQIQHPREERDLLQFHYHEWPDDGVPSHATALIDMIGQLHPAMSDRKRGPVTVHCSGGGDRSSVFCALSMSVAQLQDEGSVDVFQTTRSLRDQRQHMVPSIKEYEFIYKALLEYLETHGPDLPQSPSPSRDTPSRQR